MGFVLYSYVQLHLFRYKRYKLQIFDSLSRSDLFCQLTHYYVHYVRCYGPKGTKALMSWKSETTTEGTTNTLCPDSRH